MIPVTKPYLPSVEKFKRYIDEIYEREWLTNSGPLVQKLTERLAAYLQVDNLLLVSNGTLALQIAYRTLGLSDCNFGTQPEAITTPFTFIATASSLKWEGIQPSFVDIDPDTWCIDPNCIEDAINKNTRAVVPVHVFGNACDVDLIEKIAKKRDVKVIYDASHAFGVTLNGQSILKYGDASTLSFHATKLFHTIEGGAIVFRHRQDLEKARRMINFGIGGLNSVEDLGINAKMNEVQAAMGLCLLDELEANLRGRAAVGKFYEEHLPRTLTFQKRHTLASNNYAYIPIVLHSEESATALVSELKELEIVARRYFYPSLDRLDHILASKGNTERSQDIASRIVCLPIYSNIPDDALSIIVDAVKKVSLR